MSHQPKKPVTAYHWLMGTAAHIIPRTLASLAVVGLVMSSIPTQAFALDAKAIPTGGVVVGGNATITSGAGILTVKQNTNRAVIDWNSFNIGQDAKAEFKQLNANSIAVNRVTGGADPSQILGTLKSNGRIVILDQNGVLFGASAKVDVGGIVASTGNINAAQFMSSNSTKLDITGMTSGTVENRGTITVKQGGLAAFVAPHVVNSGVIQANLGRVELASGSAVTLDFYGDQMVAVAVTGAVANALIENSGTLSANGGRVAMTARTASNIVDSVINMDGVIRAQSVDSKQGRIVLSGGDTGGVNVTGTIDATSTKAKGGYVEMTGHDVHLNHAKINASGLKGGGTVYVGGGVYGTLNGTDNPAQVTTVSADSVINADATQNGNGGTIVVWGDEMSQFHGKATARGGSKSGNGGFIEVSTGDGVIFDGVVDTRATKGKVGQFVIDPASVSIGNDPDSGDGTYLNAQNLANVLALTSITVMADDNIDVVDDIDLASSALFGTTLYDFQLLSQTVNLLGNVNLGEGRLVVTAPTLNLDALVTKQGGAASAFYTVGSASTVNVQSNNASIQQAINFSTANATVNVASGSYNENITLNKAGMILRGNAGTIDAGADATAAAITAAGNVMTVAANNVSIEGFNISGGTNGVTGAGTGVTIAQNTFGNLTNDAINFASSNNLNVHHNLFSGIGADAIDVANSTGLQVASNIIRGQNGGTGAGAHAINLDNTDGAIISNNLIEGLTGGKGAGGSGIRLVNSDGATVTNNTVHADAATGSVGAGGTAFDLQNNTNTTVSNNQTVNDGTTVDPDPTPDPDPVPNPNQHKIDQLQSLVDILEIKIGKLQTLISNTSNRTIKKLLQVALMLLEKQVDVLEAKIAVLEAGTGTGGNSGGGHNGGNGHGNGHGHGNGNGNGHGHGNNNGHNANNNHGNGHGHGRG